MRRRHVPDLRETGSATVVGLVLVAVLVTVTLAGLTGGALLLAHRRAAAAADLAALAAARAVAPLAGLAGGEPCTVAATLARANDARLTGCRTSGLEVGVEVTVTVVGPFGASWDVPGRARAGPSAPAGPSP